jgi:NADPH-dependent 2,4-dienoyl-CoA reductase/sulfur reductase-like enzyme
MQLAVTARERGHDVELWERGAQLGGQMRMSAALPTQDSFLRYLAHQENTLRQVGVRVKLQQEATAASVIAAGADVVAIATGARARRPAIEGVDGPRVFDLWQLLGGVGGRDRASGLPDGIDLGTRVAIVAQDDHVPPLAAADWLASRGHRVTLIHATNAPGPLVSRYTLGAILARLSRAGVEIVCMEDVARIELPRVVTRHTYSQLERVYDRFDAVVLACGGIPEDGLYRELEGRVPELHVLGDAFAPRRNVNATRQGWTLGRAI